MERPLSGRTALVTGAGKRLGRAIALALAKEGVNIVAHYNTSRAETDSLVDECTRLGRRAHAVCADLSVPAEAEALAARAHDLAGSLDIIVNNASVFPSDTLSTFTVASVEHNMMVNAVAPALIARAFASRAQSGDIINLLDARMDSLDEEHLSYHLSKRMLYTFTRLMALEYAPGVRVNGIAPGLVLPPVGKDQSYLESLRNTNPLESHGDPEDVAAAALFLLRTGFTTGQVIYVDGGRHMRGGVYG